AARVSYGKGTKTKHEDEGLIRYLMRHRHTTPFEQCELKFHVKVPMDCWRQWIRHRTASVNEYSTRYSEAIDDKQETKPDEWRLQDIKKNLQGSEGFLLSENKDISQSGRYYTGKENMIQNLSMEVYKERLDAGIAREQARKDLPLSTYTMAYWKCDLHNLLHFLSLRMDSHAQLEIRSYANIIGNEIVAKLFPLTWVAFQDYRLNAITLTARDIKMINKIKFSNKNLLPGQVRRVFFEDEFEDWFQEREDGTLKNNIERLEFEEKALDPLIDLLREKPFNEILKGIVLELDEYLPSEKIFQILTNKEEFKEFDTIFEHNKYWDFFDIIIELDREEDYDKISDLINKNIDLHVNYRPKILEFIKKFILKTDTLSKNKSILENIILNNPKYKAREDAVDILYELENTDNYSFLIELFKKSQHWGVQRKILDKLFSHSKSNLDLLNFYFEMLENGGDFNYGVRFNLWRN
ncbi:hypothetical protein LCGC14_2593970, partial [marine sediment metagenome]